MIGKKMRYFLFFLALLSFSNLNAQRRILMEKEGGVYKVPCTVNGAKMKFIFDTGAAKVSLSLAMAQYLFENGYLSKNDIVGSSKSSIASGEIVDNIDIIIRDIEINGLHLKNVHAWVSRSLNAPLLLGQSAIQKLGPVTIDGNYLIINNVERELSLNEANQLRDRIKNHYYNKEYLDVIRLSYKLDEGYGLIFNDYQALICSCFNMKRYVECAETCERLLHNKNIELNNQDNLNVYRYLTSSYYNSHEYTKAIDAGKQGLNYCNTTDYNIKSILCYYIGYSYDQIGNQEKCLDYYNLGLDTLTSAENVSNEDFFSGNIHSKDIQSFVLLIGKHYMNHGNTLQGAHYLAIGANSGNSECLRFCKLYNINYKKLCKNILNFTKGKR